MKLAPPASPHAAATRTDDTSATAATVDSADRVLWRAATVVSEAGAAAEVILAQEEPDASQRYDLLEVLGRGGMGEVTLCRDQSLGRDVALKTMLAALKDDARLRKRFLREVRVQGQLEHPSVVPVYELGQQSDGQPFFTMRRVRGRTLTEVLEGLAAGDAALRERFTRRRLLEDFARVCLAVDYAHTRGVIHRDLKPDNVMLGDFGEVYVLDWGIARVRAEEATEAPVRPGDESVGRGALVGTPAYMAPEQLLGQVDKQDARTDVYALGAILFELLTLTPLRRGALSTITADTLAGLAVRPSERAPEVPPELDALCLRALDGDAAERFPSARALANEVERYLEGDRDRAQRRAHAERHLAAARALLTADGSAAGRSKALREALKALTYDADVPEGRALLLELLLEPPKALPPDAEAELEAENEKQRASMARYGFYGLLSWLGTIPFILFLGVRNAWAFALPCALTLAAALAAWRLWKHPSASMMRLATVLVLANCAALSCWLGPFVLVPMTTATALGFVTTQATPRERRWLLVLSALPILVPLVLELLGVLPRSFAFEAGRLVLYPRAVYLPPLGTILALAYSSVAGAALLTVLTGRLRDQHRVAERTLFAQAWQLRQLGAESRE